MCVARELEPRAIWPPSSPPPRSQAAREQPGVISLLAAAVFTLHLDDDVGLPAGIPVCHLHLCKLSGRSSVRISRNLRLRDDLYGVAGVQPSAVSIIHFCDCVVVAAGAAQRGSAATRFIYIDRVVRTTGRAALCLLRLHGNECRATIKRLDAMAPVRPACSPSWHASPWLTTSTISSALPWFRCGGAVLSVNSYARSMVVGRAAMFGHTFARTAVGRIAYARLYAVFVSRRRRSASSDSMLDGLSRRYASASTRTQLQTTNAYTRRSCYGVQGGRVRASKCQVLTRACIAWLLFKVLRAWACMWASYVS